MSKMLDIYIEIKFVGYHGSYPSSGNRPTEIKDMGFYDSTAVKEREDKTSKCRPQGANTPSTQALLAQLMNLNRNFSIKYIQ